MKKSYFVIHTINVLVGILLGLVFSYYFDLFDSRSGPFVGFEGKWVCDNGNFEINSNMEVKYHRGETDHAVGKLMFEHPTKARLKSEGPNFLEFNDSIVFEGFGRTMRVEKMGGGMLYLCRPLRFFERF